MLALALGLATTAVVSALMWRSASPWTLALDAGNSFLGQTVPAFQAWASGRVPEWTDLLWGGFPAIAEPTTAALYPLHAVAYAMTRHAPLRFFDVALAVHFGILAAGSATFLRRLGASPGACVFGTALAVLSPFPHGSAVACVAQFEAMAWWPWTFAAAEWLVAPTTPLVGAAMTLGWVALAAQVLAGIPEYALYSGGAAFIWIATRRTSIPIQDRARRMGLLAGGALALAAPQLLTTLAYLPATTRASGPVAVELGSLWITDPIRIFVIGMGAMSGVTCFIGLGVIVLAAVAVIARRPGARVLAGIAIASFLLALGPQVGLYEILHRVPPFDLFRVPIKFYTFVELALAWTAALGLDASWRRGTGGARAAAVAIALVAVAEHVAYVVTAERTVLDAVYLRAPEPDLTTRLDAIAALHTRGGAGEPPPTTMDMGFPMGGTLAYSLGALVGMSSLHPGDVSLLPPTHTSLLYGRPLQPKALSLLGVRYALIPSAQCERVIAFSRWRLLESLHTFCILENPTPSALFETVAAATPVASVEAMLVAVRERPTAPVPVMAPPVLLSNLGPGVVLVLSYAPGHAQLATASALPTLLVVRQSLVPGWEARVDGVPSILLPAAGLFFAVPLAPGVHRIELGYRAAGLRPGLVVSAVWVAAMSGVFLVRRRRARMGATIPIRSH